MPGEWQARFETSASVTCAIDVDSTIVYCNPAWNVFAIQNNGNHATADYVLGRSLFAYIPATLAPHYRKIVETSRVRRHGAGSDYQCHSTDKFRTYRLMVFPIPHTDLLAMVHSLRVERAMTYKPLNVSSYHHGPGNVVTMCAQCRRTRNSHDGDWNWVPEFIRSPPMRISHGICPECTMYLYA
jgi:hypothetical protein